MINENFRLKSALRYVVTAGLIFTLIFSALSCSESNEWLMFRGEKGLGATSSSVKPPIAIKWKLQLQVKGDTARAFNPPVIMDGVIYFGSNDGNFYALDIQTGFMRWVFKTGERINSIPCCDGKNVYFGSDDGKLYAVSREDGKEAWSFDTGEYVQSLVSGYEDSIFFVTNGPGAGYFLDKNGTLLHSIPNASWEKYTFMIHDQILYFAPGIPEDSTALAAYDIRNNMYLWSLGAQIEPAKWYSVPAVDDQMLFMATTDFGPAGFLFNYYALDRLTGEVVWKASADSSLYPGAEAAVFELIYDYVELLDYMAPCVSNDLVIFSSGDRSVRAFDRYTGELAWEQSFSLHTSSAPTVAGDRIYLGLDGNDSYQYGMAGDIPPRLLCLSARDGRVMWNLPVEGKLLSAPVVAGKWVVFGTDRHCFYVLEEVF